MMIVHIYTSFVGFIITIVCIQSIDAACSAKFQLITDHSACLSKSEYAQTSGVSEAEKTEIVDRHNHHRGNVNPAATDMLKMSWDDEVALVAQAYADNCVNGHDDSYARRIPGRYSAGQNLAAATGTHSWTDRIDSWQSEVSRFQMGTGATDGGDVGHYTQVVWAKSHKIGCGYTYCSNGIEHFYVCNYSPAGNIMPNQYSPYTSGTSCGDCPTSRSGNLCDCSSMDCYNGGTLNVDSCTCTCKNAPYYVGSSCDLNCTDIGTPPCGFTQSQCSVYLNVPDDCPVTCGFCAVSTTTTTSSTTTTTDSAANTIHGQHFLLMTLFVFVSS